MKGVLYLLLFFPKDVVKKIHSHLILSKRIFTPFQTKSIPQEILMYGPQVSYNTGPLYVNSISVTRVSSNVFDVDIVFKIENQSFKEWLLHWENIMHMYYQEKGIQKKRSNIIQNNTIFYKRKENEYYGNSKINPYTLNIMDQYNETRWGCFRMGECVLCCTLIVLGIRWERDETKMLFTIGI